MTIDVHAVIEEQWKERYVAQGLKYGTMAYRKAEIEFFTGAMAAMTALDAENAMPPRWVLPVMTGRFIAEKAVQRKHEIT